jgi:hypothetical protein
VVTVVAARCGGCEENLGVIARLGHQDVSREWFWWSDIGMEAVGTSD